MFDGWYPSFFFFFLQTSTFCSGTWFFACSVHYRYRLMLLSFSNEVVLLFSCSKPQLQNKHTQRAALGGSGSCAARGGKTKPLLLDLPLFECWLDFRRRQQITTHRFRLQHIFFPFFLRLSQNISERSRLFLFSVCWLNISAILLSLPTHTH